jgi:predicted nucleic acid-binding protein
MQSRAVYEAWLAWAAKAVKAKDCSDQTRNIIGATAAKYGLGTVTDNTHRFTKDDLEKLTDAELEGLAGQ